MDLKKANTATTTVPNIASTTLNFNVGVLGHVDSGKTSLAKVLSTTQSTACFDKNPQSKQRGITLDLGFSSFTVPAPQHLSSSTTPCQLLQFTLVDCPGHASLIRTIIGGARIVDMVMLVVDANKGFQTQTAECLVLSEIMASKMLVVVNKIDLISAEKREAVVEKLRKRLLKTLEKTKFQSSAITFVSANPEQPMGIDHLIEVMKESSFRPHRDPSGPFSFSIDHCFLIKGQGTVMTGTVLSGSVCVNDMVEVGGVGEVGRVKSMQMFKKPVSTAQQGDRIGLCVRQLEACKVERGVLSHPGYLSNAQDFVANVHNIAYFKGKVLSKAGKLHITVGHETQMGTCVFFGESQSGKRNKSGAFSFDWDYPYLDELTDKKENEDDPLTTPTDPNPPPFRYAHIHLDNPLPMHPSMLMVASKLDSNVHGNACRLVFHGCILHPFNPSPVAMGAAKGSKGVERKGAGGEGGGVLSDLKVFKVKRKEGVVDRKMDEYTVICKDLFKKETNLEIFTGAKVVLSSGEVGSIEGGFGQSGKVKVNIPGGLTASTSVNLSNKKGGKKKDRKEDKKEDEETHEKQGETVRVTLSFKKFLYNNNNKITSL